jgi:hypothetical protein
MHRVSGMPLRRPMALTHTASTGPKPASATRANIYLIPCYAHVSSKFFCNSTAFDTNTFAHTPNPCSLPDSAMDRVSGMPLRRPMALTHTASTGPTHLQHQSLPQGQHLPHHPAMPMSPRNSSTTPTLSHTHPTPVHAPIPPQPLSHQPMSLRLAPSPSMLSSTTPPTKGLNATSSLFVPRKQPVAVAVKTPDGAEVDWRVVELHWPRTLPLLLVPLDSGKEVLGAGDPPTSNLNISESNDLPKKSKKRKRKLD